ncbi:general odorant-binding protein 56a-like [Leptopilina heterotoma]|uniref:general odorant-binding protein 56a-like n=1 Tax=Leptopilina heterotoma TaxID=63436 RepID=UPI001CA93B1F|nr:general odorant-binding protein 56a-like [Leptopilina heterotoma]
MKNIILIILSVFLISVRGNTLRKCRKETGVSSESLKKLRAGDFNVEDRNLKCYLRCVLIKHRVLNEKNVINLGKVLKFFPQNSQARVRSNFDKCKVITGKDKCDKIFQVAKCFFKLEPEILKTVSSMLA